MGRASPIPSARKKRQPRESVILRDLSIRESNALQVTFSKFECDFWKLTWTRAGNFRMPTREAATYVMVRLHDFYLRTRLQDTTLQSPDSLAGHLDQNAKAALTLADKISVHLPE